jgi:SnoaL-like domain
VAIDFVGVQLPATVTAKELREQSEPSYARVKTQHMSTNLDIRVDGDKATSTSYGHARHERTDKDGFSHSQNFWHIYAKYENDYIRTDDGWKISRIKMEPRWYEGNPKLLEEATAAGNKAT